MLSSPDGITPWPSSTGDAGELAMSIQCDAWRLKLMAMVVRNGQKRAVNPDSVLISQWGRTHAAEGGEGRGDGAGIGFGGGSTSFAVLEIVQRIMRSDIGTHSIPSVPRWTTVEECVLCRVKRARCTAVDSFWLSQHVADVKMMATSV